MNRGFLVSAIYRKTTEISITAIDNLAAVTLMSTDTERITNALQGVHEIWANLVQIGIATSLLERELGLACLAPVLVAAGSVSRNSLFKDDTENFCPSYCCRNFLSG